MKYCCINSQRQGSCYLEFQKGTHCGKFWLDDSVYMSDDDFEELGLYKIFKESIENFNHYGITAVSCEQWDNIKKLSAEYGNEVHEAIEELDTWVKDYFNEYEFFSILGI